MGFEDELNLLKICLFAQGAMVTALARAHPQPDRLRALFGEEASDTIVKQHAEGAAEEWIRLLRQMLEQYRAHIPGESSGD